MGTGTSGRARIVVLLGYDQDPVKWRERHARGEALDVTPYGYELGQEWFDVEWARSHPESALVARVRRSVAARLGYDFVHAWRNRRLLRSADVVWTHTEREHLAVAALPWRRPRLVVAQSVWLWDRWPHLSKRRRGRTAKLLRRHAVEVTLSPVNAEASRQAVPDRRVIFVPFGSQIAVSAGDQPSSNRTTSGPLVLAPGNDVHRDWPLLRDVAARLPHITFRIATGKPAARALAWPDNAHVGPAPYAELRDLYAECAAVAVPLTPNLHASGITVGIEGLGAGRPLVISRTGGVEAYFDGVAELPPEGDVGAFADAVERAVLHGGEGDDIDRRRSRGLTQRDYVLRLVHLSRALLGGPWEPSISELSPVPAPAGD